jgi:predicted TIM-barrel fold metal-dependent hydrolase
MGRPELPPGLDPKRFARAIGIDGFAIPLDNSAIGNNPRQKMFVEQVEFWPNIVRKEVDPQSFDDYLNMISTAMENFQKGGGISFKMNHAYWRDIAVDLVSKDEAADVYEKKDNSLDRYKKLQDYLIRHMIAKAGTLDLPVHIHTGGAPGLPQPMVYADPSRFDPFLWLPDLLNTKIVLLHGGYPFTREIGFMASRPSPPAPNIYLDVSAITWCQYSSPMSLASYLRDWFGMGAAPKMLYGSDAADPVSMLLSAINIREALYLALKGMIEDGLYNQSQAFMVAQMFLRDNAKILYKNAV